MSYAGIIVSFVLVDNLVFTYFLGLRPVMDGSQSTRGVLALGLSLTVFLTLTAALSRMVNALVLIPLGLGFLRTVMFVLVVVGVITLADYAMRRMAPSLRRLLYPNQAVMTAHCATLGIMLIAVRADYDVIESLVAGASAGIGILLATGLMAALREQLDREWVPEPFRGAPIAFISAGLIAMALFAFDRALLINVFG